LRYPVAGNQGLDVVLVLDAGVILPVEEASEPLIDVKVRPVGAVGNVAA